MMKRLIFSVLAVLACFLVIDASELALDDMESIKISLLPESEGPIVVSDKDKSILRYGFHRTHDCHNFEKAFICVRKCLDLDFQIAHADKSCVCTCYKNSVIAKYKAPVAIPKWKLGAPTTSLPPWAGGNGEKKPHDYEINANVTEFIDDSDNETTTAAPGEENSAASHDETTAAPDDAKEPSGEHTPENSAEAVTGDSTDTMVTTETADVTIATELPAEQ